MTADAAPDRMIDALMAALPAEAVTPGPRIEPRYLGDWMVHDATVRPAVLVRPADTEQTSTALRILNQHGVPVVAQGGRTGLAGGAAPANGWAILAMERMRAIQAPDPASSSIVVEAGAPLQAVQEAADRAGLLFPLDLGARGTCTIGGNISTNAGGNRVLRYGMMRELVLGLEAVLADGTVLSSMNVMLKNNTGYDLKQLFIGSEGTLGVVTRAVLRLYPRPSTVQTALCALDDYDAVLSLLGLARERLGPTLSAFEVMWPGMYRLGTDGKGLAPPLAHGAGVYVLLEASGSDPERDETQFQAFVEAAYEKAVIGDAVIAQSIKETRDLWAVRDAAGELRTLFGDHVIFDVSLPIGDMWRFVEDCRGRFERRWPSTQMVWFGHIADSNIHIGVRVPEAEAQPEAEIEDILYDAVGDYAGSISAEHGIGTVKRGYLDRSRSAQEIEAMRRLKRAFDPNGILNPGKVLA